MKDNAPPRRRRCGNHRTPTNTCSMPGARRTIGHPMPCRGTWSRRSTAPLVSAADHRAPAPSSSAGGNGHRRRGGSWWRTHCCLESAQRIGIALPAYDRGSRRVIGVPVTVRSWRLGFDQVGRLQRRNRRATWRRITSSITSPRPERWATARINDSGLVAVVQNRWCIRHDVNFAWLSSEVDVASHRDVATLARSRAESANGIDRARRCSGGLHRLRQAAVPGVLAARR